MGRYMLPNKQEFRCRTIDMSVGGLLIHCAVPPYRGQRVVVYLDELGRVEGTATRVTRDTFALSISSTSLKRERITAALTWLANSEELEMQESRASKRIEPLVKEATLTLGNGKSATIVIGEFSLSGLTIKTELALPTDSRVMIGRRPAQVVRAIDGGYALHFQTPLKDDELTPNMIFC